MPTNELIHVAWFITPHGFGHASRATAIMLALEKRLPVHFEIFTRVPQWFFSASFLTQFTYHDCLTDIGLVQRTSLEEDIPATLSRLEGFLPYSRNLLENLAEQLKSTDCRFVVCDIAPLGIAAAEAAGLPSLLVENFTWDWIYSGYANPGMDKYIKILKHWFDRVTYHIQTRPVCVPGNPVLTTSPVSRPFRQSRQEVRRLLGIGDDQPALLITMGGIETRFADEHILTAFPQVAFVLPGSSPTFRQEKNLFLFPHQSSYYHPDLLAACDAVIGKLGYSTLAEAYASGVPYGFIPRARFAESPPLSKFVLEEMPALQIPEDDFNSGAWIERLPDLLKLPIRKPDLSRHPDGAGQLADWIARRLRV